MKRQKSRNARSRRGSAMIFALIVLFVLSLGTAVLWRQIHINLAGEHRAWRQEQAYQLAEAGLEHAIAHLRAGGAAETVLDRVPLGAGVYTVRITPGDEPGAFRVASEAQLDAGDPKSGEVTLHARVGITGGRLVTCALEPAEGAQP